MFTEVSTDRHAESAPTARTPEDSREEFVIELRRIGLDVPAERVDDLFLEYVEMRRLVQIVRAQTVSGEPANGFSLTAVIRSMKP